MCNILAGLYNCFVFVVICSDSYILYIYHIYIFFKKHDKMCYKLAIQIRTYIHAIT